MNTQNTEDIRIRIDAISNTLREMQLAGAPKLAEPITVSGWYTSADGITTGLYHWREGFPKLDVHIMTGNRLTYEQLLGELFELKDALESESREHGLPS